ELGVDPLDDGIRRGAVHQPDGDVLGLRVATVARCRLRRVAATARRGEQSHRGADDGRRANFSVHLAILLVRPVRRRRTGPYWSRPVVGRWHSGPDSVKGGPYRGDMTSTDTRAIPDHLD